jgi:hypothetical protein
MTERRWQLTPQDPTALQIAADARLSPTDYLDDQVWEVVLGKPESPALALQTRYGGRVGLASLVPMWVVERRPVYQYQAYAVPPIVTVFAPGYVRLEAKVTPTLTLRAEYWVIESHAVGGRFTVKNTAAHALPDLALDLVGFAAAQGHELKLRPQTDANGAAALALGQIGSLQPIVLLENGYATPDSSSKVSVKLSLPPRGQAAARFVHVALPDAAASLALAQKLLAENWNTALRKVSSSLNDIPYIETGDENLDTAIAFSYHHLVQAFLKPTASLPYPSFVAVRQPDRGFSPRGDGTDHPRSWSGQLPTLAYLSALAVAPVEDKWGWGVLRNYLAVQRPDGWIDWKPGLAGQKQGILCLPILARLAWGLFQYTEDAAALREVYPKLVKFFEAWLKQDADDDGFPEWQSEVQTGYPFFPTFAQGLPWGQNADIRYFETPDLLAYLLSEAVSLREIAYFLGDSAGEAHFDQRVKGLGAALDALWNGERYAYRDRDTHYMGAGRVLLEGGRGDETHILAEILDPPQRLIVQINGGIDAPKIMLYIDGKTHAGENVREAAETTDFVWSSGHGSYTTKHAYQQVDRVHVEGLSRVYTVTVTTPDTTGFDVNALLPLWAVEIPPERAAALVELLRARFMCPNGMVMVAADDPRFDPKDAEGGAGVRSFWMTLIGEGLIETGQVELATDLLKRLMRAQTAALTADKAFHEFYHPDEARGLGETGHLAGIIPLHLLLRVLGVRIISKKKVWTGGAYHWNSPVTVTQFGVTVKRAAEGIEIEFPSGKRVMLPADAAWQEVIDEA